MKKDMIKYCFSLAIGIVIAKSSIPSVKEALTLKKKSSMSKSVDIEDDEIDEEE